VFFCPSSSLRLAHIGSRFSGMLVSKAVLIAHSGFAHFRTGFLACGWTILMRGGNQSPSLWGVPVRIARHAVSGIIRWCPFVQMGWVAARRVVASVKTTRRRPTTVGQIVGNAMGNKLLTYIGVPKMAIPVTVRSALPRPTPVRSAPVNLGPELLLYRNADMLAASTVRWTRFTTWHNLSSIADDSWP
jgi:hypothetical protein